MILNFVLPNLEVNHTHSFDFYTAAFLCPLFFVALCFSSVYQISKPCFMLFSLPEYLSVYLAGLCLSNYIRNSLQQLDSTVLSISFAHVCIHMVTQIQGQGVQQDIFICSCMYTYGYTDKGTGCPTKYIHLVNYKYIRKRIQRQGAQLNI